MDITSSRLGSYKGKDIFMFSIFNDKGMEIRVMNYGGIVTHLFVPDSDELKKDVVLGFDSLDQYLEDHPFFGAVIGRFGNRIALGRFTLDGKEYQLPINLGPHCLHGGYETFAHRVWDIRPIKSSDLVGVELSLVSQDGEEGFPGTLHVRIRYQIDNNNCWYIKYRAVTDAPTILNLTQHSYFNLNGHQSGQVLDHYLNIAADHYTPVDETMIPTGELAHVEGSPFDFRVTQKIGLKMDGGLDPMIESSRGYDLNYVLNGNPGELRKVAEATGNLSGIKMEVFTNEPGAQLYIGNWLNGIHGKEGVVYNPYHGLCIETQHFPDAPNQDSFPNTILRPGEVFESETRYQFSSAKNDQIVV